ncbi:MAG TPA: hypothetical protein VGM50_08350 [Gemmatimonadaceae bacterium]
MVFDSLRAGYVTDLKAVNGAAAVSDVGLVMRRHGVGIKYQKLVRAIIASDEQPTFDRNVAALRKR